MTQITCQRSEAPIDSYGARYMQNGLLLIYNIYLEIFIICSNVYMSWWRFELVATHEGLGRIERGGRTEGVRRRSDRKKFRHLVFFRSRDSALTHSVAKIFYGYYKLHVSHKTMTRTLTTSIHDNGWKGTK